MAQARHQSIRAGKREKRPGTFARTAFAALAGAMDAGSSLVPNLTDRFQSVTYNEDSSIVYYPRKFLPFRRSAPRECAVIFNSAKIAPSAKIVFLYRGHYYMRTLGQFKEELVSGLWQ